VAAPRGAHDLPAVAQPAGRAAVAAQAGPGGAAVELHRLAGASAAVAAGSSEREPARHDENALELADLAVEAGDPHTQDIAPVAQAVSGAELRSPPQGELVGELGRHIAAVEPHEHSGVQPGETQSDAQAMTGDVAGAEAPHQLARRMDQREGDRVTVARPSPGGDNVEEVAPPLQGAHIGPGDARREHPAAAAAQQAAHADSVEAGATQLRPLGQSHPHRHRAPVGQALLLGAEHLEQRLVRGACRPRRCGQRHGEAEHCDDGCPPAKHRRDPYRRPGRNP